MRSWDEIIIARKIATGEVADQRLETCAADGEAVTVHEFPESARPALLGERGLRLRISRRCLHDRRRGSKNLLPITGEGRVESAGC